jgi:small subunit ribosomal protein S17
MNLLTGIVYSKKMNKTVIVQITKKNKHTKYKKYINKNVKYFVHDENNICNQGDLISFNEVAQISKKKKWKLNSILKKA